MSKTLRQHIRHQRRSLDEHSRFVAAGQLAKHVLGNRAFRCAKRVACYLPNDGEIDPTMIIEHLWARGTECYLPVLNPLGHNRLAFAPFTAGTPLTLNCFGIVEPDVHPSEWIRPIHLDVVLAPLVAFDDGGNRMGMGGGYYDRSFAFLRHRRHWLKPRLIGIAYDFQRVEKLQAQRHDVPLYTVITDSGVRKK